MRSTRGLHNVGPTRTRTPSTSAASSRSRTCKSYDEARLQTILEGQVYLRRNRVMLPSSKQVPRLTGALRAFGEVSSEDSREDVSFDESLLLTKRKRKPGSGSTEKTWGKVTEKVLAACGRQDERKVRFCLQYSVGTNWGELG